MYAQMRKKNIKQLSADIQQIKIVLCHTNSKQIIEKLKK